MDSIKWAVGVAAVIIAYAAFVATLVMLAYIPYAIIKLYLF